MTKLQTESGRALGEKLLKKIEQIRSAREVESTSLQDLEQQTVAPVDQAMVEAERWFAKLFGLRPQPFVGLTRLDLEAMRAQTQDPEQFDWATTLMANVQKVWLRKRAEFSEKALHVLQEKPVGPMNPTVDPDEARSILAETRQLRKEALAEAKAKAKKEREQKAEKAREARKLEADARAKRVADRKAQVEEARKKRLKEKEAKERAEAKEAEGIAAWVAKVSGKNKKKPKKKGK